MRLSHVDETAGTDRFVEFGLDATRGAVREAARGEPLPFEEPCFAGPDDEVFPRFEYVKQARAWLPHPDELAERMAGSEWLDEHDGRYYTGGGDWFQLHRLDADRVLLVSNNVEDHETFFGAAVTRFGGGQA